MDTNGGEKPSIDRRAARGKDIRGERGFTLIEIMVVVVILGILGAMIVPNIMNRPDEARVTIAANDVKSLASTLEMYRLDNGHYPSTDQGLEALVSEPSGYPEPRKWRQYLKSLPTDPWEEPYLYVSEGQSFEVYTFGADRKEGGEGFDADISSADD